MEDLKYAVACVLKAMSKPINPGLQFGQTSAMEKFIEKFNANEISGGIRDIVYSIVGQDDRSQPLTIEDFTAQEVTITEMSDLAMEKGFDISSTLPGISFNS